MSTILIIASSSQAISQNTLIVGRIKVGEQADVYKQVKVTGCEYTYKPLTVISPITSVTEVIKETKNKSGEVEITVKEVITHKGTSDIKLTKDTTVSVAYKGFAEGNADFYLNENDKTKLYISYWLGEQHKVDKGMYVKAYKPIYDCSGNLDVAKSVVGSQSQLGNDSWYNGHKVAHSEFDGSKNWIKNSNWVEVLKPNGSTDYYIVDRYDQESKYVMKLGVRKYVSYSYPSIGISAITIPIKVRPEFTEQDILVPGEAAAALNIGAFGSYRLTKKHIKNDLGTYKAIDKGSVHAGLFLSASVVSLDNKNTTVGDKPLDTTTTRTLAAISTGLGVTANFKGLQIGFFSGWDFGIGKQTKNWNHEGKVWWGFGIGYKITDLFTQKSE